MRSFSFGSCFCEETSYITAVETERACKCIPYIVLMCYLACMHDVMQVKGVCL